MHTTHEETTDFNSKLQEISHIENGISHLKNAFQLLMTNTTGFKSIIQELTVSLKFLYNGNSPYYSLSSNMYNCYIQLEKLYSDFYENIKKLLTQLNELGNSYEYVDDLIDKRAERKKVFEYYNEKLSKLNTKDEHYERNETKYNKAQNEFIECHNQTYQSILNVLSKKYTDINPVFNDFFRSNFNLYSKASNLFIYANKNTSTVTPSSSSNKNIYYKKEYMSFNDYNKPMGNNGNLNNANSGTNIPQQQPSQTQFRQGGQGKVYNVPNNGSNQSKDVNPNNLIVFSQYDDAFQSLQIKNTMNQSHVVLEGTNIGDNNIQDNYSNNNNNNSKIIL